MTEGAIVVCSLCGSREGPMTDIRQGGNYNQVLGCACPKCKALPEDEWQEKVKGILPVRK